MPRLNIVGPHLKTSSAELADSKPTLDATHDYSIHDAPLSPLGLNEQCPALRRFLQDDLDVARRIELIVVSPLQRTLQTATHALQHLITQGVPVLLRADWQEMSAKPCDTGTAIPIMQRRWPRYDWSTVDPIFPAKEGLYAYTEEMLLERGRHVRRWLRARPEKVIAVVSHAGFLSSVVSHAHYMNADCRVFDFASDDDDGPEERGIRLVEWKLSEDRGDARGLSLKGHRTLKDAFEAAPKGPPGPAADGPVEEPQTSGKP